MAREREVVVGRVGPVLRTPGGSGGETLNPARLHEGSGGPGAYSASGARPGEGVGSGSSWPPCLLGDPLYVWNTVVSGAFYEPLQGLEIALRHALHGQLTRCYGEAWSLRFIPRLLLALASAARRTEAAGLRRSGAAESRSRGWALRATVLACASRRVGMALWLYRHGEDGA